MNNGQKENPKSPGEIIGNFIDQTLSLFSRTQAGIDSNMSQNNREITAAIVVAIVAVFSLVISFILYSPESFTASFLLNLATELIGNGFFLWLIHARLSNLPSKDGEELREIKNQLSGLKEYFEQSQSPSELNADE